MSEWEHIAPEDPPGFLFDEGERGYPYTVVAPVGDQSAWVEHDSPEQARAWAWACLGGRKRYAELIAVERVRVAAEAKYGRSALDGVIVIAKIHPESCVFEIVWRDALSVYESEYSGPDICTAALATIQALGGGE